VLLLLPLVPHVLLVLPLPLCYCCRRCRLLLPLVPLLLLPLGLVLPLSLLHALVPPLPPCCCCCCCR
jgi:hypothetical protein